MSGTTIRLARFEDAAVVSEFNLALAMETEELRLDPGVVGKGVAAILKDSTKGLYFLAEANGRVEGQVMITYEWSDWRDGNIWWLQSVYVRPEARAKGVFKLLLEHVRARAAEAPEVCGLRLYMHAANERARAVYCRLGFADTEYQVFELPMREPLA